MRQELRFYHFQNCSVSHKSQKRLLTPMLLKSIAMHLTFLPRYFCKSMPSSWQKVEHTPPICITIQLSFVSRSAEVLGSGVAGTPPKIALQKGKNRFRLAFGLVSANFWLLSVYLSGVQIASPSNVLLRLGLYDPQTLGFSPSRKHWNSLRAPRIENGLGVQMMEASFVPPLCGGAPR